MTKVKFVEGQFHRIVVGKDEVIAIISPRPLTASMRESIMDSASKAFPKHKVVVLEDGLRIVSVKEETK